MALTIKKKNIEEVLSKISSINSLGEYQNIYYAVHQPPLWLMILLGGGLLQAFLMKPFYIGLTDSHLVMQPVSSLLNPKGEPFILPWSEVEVLEIKKVFLGNKVFVKIKDKKYGLRMNRKIVGWENSGEEFDKIIALFKARIR